MRPGKRRWSNGKGRVGWPVLVSAWCLSLAACHPAWAQELRLAYVDLGRVFDGYERTKSSDAQLGKKGEQKETELRGRIDELKQMRESAELLGDQAREARAREIEERSDELQRFRTRTARELRRERDALAGTILEDIRRAVAEYAKAKGFTLILSDQAVLYGDSAHDVTDEVLQVLNERYRARR